MVRAYDDLHLDDRALLVGLEDRVDAVLLPENVRPFRRRLLGIACRKSYTRLGIHFAPIFRLGVSR